MQTEVNTASIKLSKAKKRGSGNLKVFEHALTKARAKRDEAMTQFIEADGNKTRRAIADSTKKVKKHVTDELKEVKDALEVIDDSSARMEQRLGEIVPEGTAEIPDGNAEASLAANKKVWSLDL